ncbi:MAG: hypothetical protein K6A35_09955 [bacterium]|nr:hypothetical protein [bacterium]
MHWFLALTSFDEYNKMLGGDGKCVWSNPFDPQLIGQVGNFFWPYDDQTINMAVLFLLISVFVLWCAFRINTCHVYKMLGGSFAAMSLLLFVGFGQPYLNVLTVLLMGAALLTLYLSLDVIAIVFLVRNLVYFGMEEKKVTNMDGTATNYPLIGGAVLAFLPFALFLWPWRGFLLALYNCHSWWIIPNALLIIALGVLAGRELLPWTELEQYPLPDGGYLREITNIFIKNGDAGRGEIFGAGLSLCLIFTSIIWLLKGELGSADIVGLFGIVSICLIMARAELVKNIKDDVAPVVEVKHRKDAWS